MSATKLSKTQQRRERLQSKNKSTKQQNAEDLKFLDQFKAEVAQDKEISPEPPAKPEEYVVPKAKIIEKATDMWKTLKTYIKKNPEFKDMENQDKLDFFRTKLNYDTFMEEFPIVSRYMICYGQYSEKAFERMLYKIETTVHPPPDKRDKGYMEDQWVRRQADYVQYLWESYQKRHQNTSERQWIWQTTYERLKKEFDDFRDMHKDIEERVKQEKKTLAGQNARELLERVVNNKQSLLPEEEELLLKQLQSIFDKKLNGEDTESTADEAPDNSKILMIETVDENRMHEIDDKYKFEEHRGLSKPPLEPISEDANYGKQEAE